MTTSEAKPFDIPKELVGEAYRQVKANKGAPGVDEQSLGEFESDRRTISTYLESDELGVLLPAPGQDCRDS